MDADSAFFFSFQCLHGVFQKVEQDLGELVLVTFHINRFRFAGQCEDDIAFFEVAG